LEKASKSLILSAAVAALAVLLLAGCQQGKREKISSQEEMKASF